MQLPARGKARAGGARGSFCWDAAAIVMYIRARWTVGKRNCVWPFICLHWAGPSASQGQTRGIRVALAGPGSPCCGAWGQLAASSPVPSPSVRRAHGPLPGLAAAPLGPRPAESQHVCPGHQSDLRGGMEAPAWGRRTGRRRDPGGGRGDGVRRRRWAAGSRPWPRVAGGNPGMARPRRGSWPANAP